MFKNIALAKVATSADEAKAFGFFRQTDGVNDTAPSAWTVAPQHGRASRSIPSWIVAPHPQGQRRAAHQT